MFSCLCLHVCLSVYLCLFGVCGISDVLDASLLLPGFLLGRTKLQLHLTETLLQLLHTQVSVQKSFAVCPQMGEDVELVMVTCSYLVPGLALSDLGLEQADLVLGLLQLADTMTCIAVVAAELALLLINPPLKDKAHMTWISHAVYVCFHFNESSSC